MYSYDLYVAFVLTHSFTFLVFAGACGLAHFWATYYVPETANISLEEIDKLFKSSAGQEEAEMKEQVSIVALVIFSVTDCRICLTPDREGTRT